MGNFVYHHCVCTSIFGHCLIPLDPWLQLKDPNNVRKEFESNSKYSNVSKLSMAALFVNNLQEKNFLSES